MKKVFVLLRTEQRESQDAPWSYWTDHAIVGVYGSKEAAEKSMKAWVEDKISVLKFYMSQNKEYADFEGIKKRIRLLLNNKDEFTTGNGNDTEIMEVHDISETYVIE